ncbi:ribonuclease R [Varunaivibrio sulfuroxidans]|uniref:Ribonuclease R n=1 Tax=Varunaivibrio sulfuroxidans TaxID=1773489 RepID=A0A4R3JAY2_9PROT|nr:ribonuclease R [Varunaivibrio sulfuroxidans]TCS62505.1 RNAse R [Varunaivibrio sulfuroxidans]WES30824.1 ribonuclease R [Varunaivibrio sulfuroxidans]
MTPSSHKPAPFPSKREILDFIAQSPSNAGKREIARAFRLDGEQKMRLKKVLREMQDEGLLQKGRGRRFAEPGSLPAVTVLEIGDLDIDGDVIARPLTWNTDDGPPPLIYMAPERRGQSALGIGDRVLARLTRIEDAADGRLAYEGRTIRRISAQPSEVLGVFKPDESGGGGRLLPTNKRVKHEFIVSSDHAADARPGDLVRAEILPGRPLGLRRARVVERLSPTGPQAISLIAIHEYDIPHVFSIEAVTQAEKAKAAPLGKREDLRKAPIITIDGADARDFDDGVFAEPDPDPANPGGWKLIVAIADVAWYVRPGDALDRDAYGRGNSVYFPDRVVPMLPEALSNGWCSLRPDGDRPCLCAHMTIDADGALKKHHFTRALIRSHARTTYEQVQGAMDGAPDETTAPLLEGVIRPLYGAYRALWTAREKRGVLDLDLPERKVVLDDAGNVARIENRVRLDSHKLIEEFMILANVAAAQTLEKSGLPCMYRIHDEPSREKLDALRQFLDGVNIPLAKGQVIRSTQFNAILERARDTPYAQMVNDVVLRSQAQAEYSPDNIGHFGLALARYSHFTSPIRRYSDLLVHRALIRALKLGDGGLEDAPKDFADIGVHLSQTERRAAGAERGAVDRFTALFLADRVGSTFSGRINGVTRFGLFVTLDDSGADGLVPIRTLPDDYYVHDETHHRLKGRKNGIEYRLGQKVEVVLVEADPVTGGMVMRLSDDEEPPQGTPRKINDGKPGRESRPTRPGAKKSHAKGKGKGKKTTTAKIKAKIKAKGASKAARRRAANTAPTKPTP